MKKITSFCSAIILLLAGQVSFAGNPLAPSPGSPPAFKMNPKLTDKDYLSNTVVFRLKPEFRALAGNSSIDNAKLNSVFARLSVQTLGKMFPNHAPPEKEKNSFGLKYADLSLIYVLTYSADVPLVDAVNLVLGTGIVMYAEPKYIYKPVAVFTPNDPFLASNSGQYFITKIKADSAWGVNTTTARGDTNVVIGIVDTGTDWDHPDLAANVKNNYADPIDGIDNDGDGYVDNFRGWDMADNDNDPVVDPSTSVSHHGSHVSGCADAVTNNGTGVAGVGFNCKFLPIKTSATGDPNELLVKGYEGITYAADHGCNVINCSWGGIGFSNVGQNVIDYATVNKDALVVCAAGNDNSTEDFYPANFNYVMSVAATTNTDHKASFSNYNYNVAVSAPGNSIYSTIYNNTYANLSGTSMASPITAGAAAIIKSYYGSTYNALQVGQKLRITCDNIDGLNPAYIGRIGRGRINLYKALTQNTPAVRMINIASTDNNDDTFVIGDTVRVSGDFINYLDPTVNLTVTMSTTSTAVTVLNPTVNVGVLATLGTFNINSSPFSFKINPSATANQVITFKLTFSDGTYTDTQYFTEVVNVDYINITINDVETTNTSKGALAYNATGQLQGLGFMYRDSAMLYESGLMIGTQDTVSDNVRGTTGGTSDNDFTKVNTIQRDNPMTISHFDLSGSFNDNGALTTKLGVLVKHRSFAWDSIPCRKFVMFQYTIKNNSTNSHFNLYAGVFADWDITSATYNTNEAAWDGANRMGYAFNAGSALYGGTKLLSHRPNHHYSIDNVTGGGGGIDISAGYTSTQKYQTMSTDRDNAGAGGGADVCNVVSTGPITLHPGDSIVVAFALIAGDNLSDIQVSAQNAQILYDHFFPEDSTAGVQPEMNRFETMGSLKTSPNPAIGKTTFSFFLVESGSTQLDIYNITGQKVLTVFNEFLEAGDHFANADISRLSAGVYYGVLTQGSHSLKQKLVVSGE